MPRDSKGNDGWQKGKRPAKACPVALAPPVLTEGRPALPSARSLLERQLTRRSWQLSLLLALELELELIQPHMTQKPVLRGFRDRRKAQIRPFIPRIVQVQAKPSNQGSCLHRGRTRARAALNWGPRHPGIGKHVGLVGCGGHAKPSGIDKRHSSTGVGN